VPRYRLNALGDAEFENMIQALLKQVIGSGTISFGAGRDGAREATYQGTAPYPSQAEQWSGDWIFQVKFHDIDLIGTQRARANILTDLAAELDKITKKYKHKCDNYILITNVPLSAVHGVGTIDRIESQIFSKYRTQIPNLAVWGADDVNRLLDNHPEVRTAYLPLLVTGDVIRELLNLVEAPQTDRAITIDSYLRTAISREENAQLDQAGDVSEQPIPLQKIFFDLDAYVQDLTKPAFERLGERASRRNLPFEDDPRTPLVWLLLNSDLDRVVIVGGPGEGKSTLGQYLAQIHRAALLDRAEEMALATDYIPDLPRLPFRVVLRDFAQWLATRASDSSESDSLDSFISEQVARFASRPFVEKDLHEILRSNPVLLVLDGLDEVTDVVVRKLLISRLSEFLDRSDNTLHSNLQVVATTRPTGYTDQFDPKAFLHFRLHKLRPEQVRGYVEKWAIARLLDEPKALRLYHTIEECIKDQQISLLMTTPLQVTILILIINSGGTPPRQREALFDEYLEVIYKREKAKGLGIIKSEKELLIGLHKYIGYLLQEEATRASTSSAALPRKVYDTVVRDYLRAHDPYSPDDEIQAEWKAITLDAGERLVLIVESPADIFGFELRSIQEFFAACYLSDTAANTDQRYERFTAIACLPHWRNVALFFAGRAGRNYPGEAAYVVEACRQIDREGVDVFVRRGAEVALELAADRALGPNRVLQRSLIEHGLAILDTKLSYRTRKDVIDTVHRLPYEDIRDHVLPILNERLTTLGLNGVVNICYLLSSLTPSDPILRKALLNLASSAGTTYVSEILGVIAAPDLPVELRMEVIRVLLDSGIEQRQLVTRLGSAPWDVICAIGTGLVQSGFPKTLVAEFGAAVARGTAYFPSAPKESTHVLPPDQGLSLLLRTARAFGKITRAGRHLIGSPEERKTAALWESAAADIPEEVRAGNFDSSDSIPGATWLLWFAHLSLGHVTSESWQRYVLWRTSYTPDSTMMDIWEYCAASTSPILRLLTVSGDAEGLETLRDIAITFGGFSGFREWVRRLNHLLARLQTLSSENRARLLRFGLGMLQEEERQVVESMLADLFDSRIQPLALESIQERRIPGVLSIEDFQQVSEWFAHLEPGSIWRRELAASRIIVNAAGLASITSSQMDIFLPILSSFSLLQLVIRIAGRGPEDSTILRHVLLQPQLTEDHGAAVESAFLAVHSDQLRNVILSLASVVGDSDSRVGDIASLLITSVCSATVQVDYIRAPFRSQMLDAVQAELAGSKIQCRRTAGIALYVVRPPRSNRDWRRVNVLLKEATTTEIKNLWAWMIPPSADLANQPERWAKEINAILQAGASDEIFVIMSDVLRSLLQRHSQSLADQVLRLGLPQTS
jgi:hypothetical protein